MVGQGVSTLEASEEIGGRSDEAGVRGVWKGGASTRRRCHPAVTPLRPLAHRPPSRTAEESFEHGKELEPVLTYALTSSLPPQVPGYCGVAVPAMLPADLTLNHPPARLARPSETRPRSNHPR